MPARQPAGRKPATAAAKRPYLRRDSRAQKLLEVAADIVERQGWAALTMSALAEHGGTSRQLVYQHFPNLEALLVKTAWHIFNDTIQGTRASIAAHPANLMEAVSQAEHFSIDLPAGRGDALWQLIAGTASMAPELETIRRGIRELVTRTWTPSLKRELKLGDADARIYAWMMVMAFWGMRQLVRDGEISRARGVSTFNGLVQRLLRSA
jgi:AcrR family transcriptional regulator